MSLITLDQAKKHLNIDEALVEDDQYIQELIEMSDYLIESDVHDTIANIAEVHGSIPLILVHAAKIIVATMYANREATIVGASISNVPLSYKYLISKYKKYTVK